MSAPLPLEGIRVADFFWLIAGPATSRVLADFGAEVIKIESVERVDRIREGGVHPPEGRSVNSNGVFNDCNTNKRSITLNLNKPRGIELAKEIVRQSDIVTNNFTGDRMERWGLGYEELVKIKPDIIAVSMPVMGSTGPYRRYGSYGNGIIAYGGLSSIMGMPDRPPIGMATLYSDFSAPYFSLSAILAALHHRSRTGEGQFIDVAQLETAVATLGPAVLDYSANGVVQGPEGNRSHDRCPHGAYRCWGSDRWLAIAVSDDDEWQRLCDAIDRPDLGADESLQTLEGRKAREDAVDAAIAAWAIERDPWQAMHLLQAAGVAAGVVADLADMVVRDPHLPSHHFREVQRAIDIAPYTTHGQPIRLDGESPELRSAPHLGEDNHYVFRELLGLSEDEFVQLMVDEVIH